MYENVVDKDKIYKKLKALVDTYSPPLKKSVNKTNKKKNIEFWSEKDIEIDGRKRKRIFFASIIIQKNYVGFYFMPIYTDTKLKSFFKPELLSLLKGKSCFYIKTLDKELESQIELVLKKGFNLYKKRGWV